jgi:hypothetical protein
MQPLPSSEVTVSLTCTSRRIRHVEQVIRSLLDQDIPASRVVLWLSREPFLMDEGVTPEDLPASLDALQGPQFAIRWTANTGPYRKLVPALQAYGGIIVTADDDTIYPRNWLRGLLAMHAQTPQAVCCWRARRMLTHADGRLAHYWRWPRLHTRVPRADCLPIGKYGVLYPPGALHPDVADAERFLELAPTTDDIWFKAMALRAGTPARNSRTQPDFRVACARTGTFGLFARYNLFGNDRALAKVFEAYALSPLRPVAEPQQAS